MKSEMIARRYANALYELAREEHTEQRFADELELVVAILAESDELRDFMQSPLNALPVKKSILADIEARVSLSAYLVNFLNILLDKDRFAQLGEIFEVYSGLMDDAAGKLRAKVTSAVALSHEQEAKLAAALSKASGKQVAIETAVDPTLIGGVVADVQGMIYDGSVRTQIARLKMGLKGEI